MSQRDDENSGIQVHSNLMDKIYYQKSSGWQKSAYLDFGTHIILMLCSMLIPFCCHGGFRTDISERLKMKHIQKARKLLASQFTSVKTIASSSASHFDIDEIDQEVKYDYPSSNCVSSGAKETKVADTYDVSRIHCE